MNEENNQYEYNDVCYSTCPEETTEISTGSYICDLNCMHFNKYLFVGQTICISPKPDNYYIIDPTVNTIASCHTY